MVTLLPKIQRRTGEPIGKAMTKSGIKQQAQSRTAGDPFAGVPFGTPGATNMVRIAFVGSDVSGDL